MSIACFSHHRAAEVVMLVNSTKFRKGKKGGGGRTFSINLKVLLKKYKLKRVEHGMVNLEKKKKKE
jgi:hypothetical protein